MSLREKIEGFSKHKSALPSSKSNTDILNTLEDILDVLEKEKDKDKEKLIYENKTLHIQIDYLNEFIRELVMKLIDKNAGTGYTSSADKYAAMKRAANGVDNSKPVDVAKTPDVSRKLPG